MSNKVLFLIPKKLIRYIDYFYDFLCKKIFDNKLDLTVIHKSSNSIDHININEIKYIFVFQQLSIFGGMIRRLLRNK